MVNLNLKELGTVCNRETKYDTADIQAEIVIKELRNKLPNIDWRIVDSSNTKENLEKGDINGFKDGKLIYMIDLKVAESQDERYWGTIDLNSVLNFANKPNSFYLYASRDGSKYGTISGIKVWDKFNSDEPTLMKTKHKNRALEVRPELNKYVNKFIKGDATDVSPYDFIPINVFWKCKQSI